MAVLAAAVLAAAVGPRDAVPGDMARLATVVVLGTAALQFPLHFSLTTKVSPAAAVFFAAVLMLPAQAAAVAVAATVLASTALSVARRVLSSGQPPPAARVVATVLFNAAASYLATLAAGFLLPLFGYAPGLVSARGLVGIAVAAVAMHTLNLLFVSIDDAVRNRTSALHAFADANQAILAPFAVLYLVGASAALLSQRFPWTPALMLVPMALVYAALGRAVQVSRETIRAVEQMADMVDRRDPYTFQHSQRVAEYAVAIAGRLRLGRADIEMLRLAATVHDLGKIAVPDSVLLKPGRLTAEEEALMRAHPRTGYSILSEFREYAKVRQLVLTHHERFAGGGYPTGLIAGGLPLVAQVIPVADSVDAMTTARPYRGPLPWAQALDVLQGGAGTQWNPRVVAAAVAVFGERREVPAAGDVEAVPALAV